MKTKRTFGRRLGCILLSLLLILSLGLPLGGLITPEAKAYSVGDTIQFGSYPQSRVTDSSLISSLNGVSKTWKSYDYYSGTGNTYDGQMQPGDWMKFCDFFYNGVKYRAVTFTSYRPGLTGRQPNSGESQQDENGYYTNNVYYFKYEPLVWKVLDPSTGYIMCQSIIDAQMYQNVVYLSGGNYYQGVGSPNYVNNYATATVREWLNEQFWNTAFTDAQKANVKTTTQDNSGYNGVYNSASTTDKIFLLSYADATNSAYQFNGNGDRLGTATEYTRAQGLWVSGGHSLWWLRTPSQYTKNGCFVDIGGNALGNNDNDDTLKGIRPACVLTTLADDPTISESLYSAGPAHEHTPGSAVTENNVPASCTANGGYDSVVYCTGCGEELSREHITVPASAHAYAESWTWVVRPELEVVTINMNSIVRVNINKDFYQIEGQNPVYKNSANTLYVFTGSASGKANWINVNNECCLTPTVFNICFKDYSVRGSDWCGGFYIGGTNTTVNMTLAGSVSDYCYGYSSIGGNVDHPDDWHNKVNIFADGATSAKFEAGWTWSGYDTKKVVYFTNELIKGSDYSIKVDGRTLSGFSSEIYSGYVLNIDAGENAVVPVATATLALVCPDCGKTVVSSDVAPEAVASSAGNPAYGRFFASVTVDGVTYTSYSSNLPAAWTQDNTVTFDPNGGTGTAVSNDYPYGKTIRLPNNTFTAPEGKLFNGWLLDGRVYQPGSSYTVTDSVTFLARWVDPVLGIFDPGEAEGEPQTRFSVLPNTTVSLPSNPFTAPEGKIFNGWSNGLRTYPAGTSYVLSQTTTFVAQWADAVYAYLEPGEAEGETRTHASVLPGTRITLPANPYPAPAGMLFNGWSDGTNVYQPGDNYTLNENVTFTAEWVRGVYVTFDSQGGTSVGTQFMYPNTAAWRPADPEKDGLYLKGWRLGDELYDFSTPLTEDTTLYAVWIEPFVPDGTEPVLISGFTATAGDGNASTSEGYMKLVDGDKYTKWGRSSTTGSVEFFSTRPFIPTAYILITGNDNASYHGRNPRNWTLQGKLRERDEWVTIASVTDDTVLEDRNRVAYTFELDGEQTVYKYFRFAYNGLQGANFFQLSELQFMGVYADTFTHSLTFSAESNVLTAACSNDPCAWEDNAQTLTLTAPEKSVYGDENSEKATLSGLGLFNLEVGLSVSEDDIEYYQGETLLSASPVNAGDYKASLTVTIDGTDYTIYKDYTIGKATPAYTAPEGLTATYGDTLGSVALPEGWAWVDPADTPVGNAGPNDFSAAFTPADPENYAVVTETLTVNVARATPDYELPGELSAPWGSRLSDVALPDGWAWNAPDTLLNEEGSFTFAATFTPADADNYVNVTDEFTVTVYVIYTPVAAKNETCTEDGNIAYYAGNDGKYYVSADGETFTEIAYEDTVLPRLGHDYAFAGFVWAADGASATAKYVCSRCGDDVYPAAEMSEEFFDFTCYDDAYTVYTATYDGHTETNTVVQTGTAHHIWDEGTYTRRPTCLENGSMRFVCTVCGEIRNDVIGALGHDVVVDPAIDPTCTERGVTEGTHCRRCAAVLVAQIVLPALGHEWSDWTETREPTCAEPGIEERTCARCGEVDERELESPAHEWSEWEITTEPGCETLGEKTRTCAVCGSVETKPAAATGHDWVKSETSTATCTEDGVWTYTCSKCGDTYEEPAAALGHDWAEGEGGTATCTAAGTVVYACSRCGETREEESSALGHVWGEWEVVREATRDENGLAKRVCARCGETEERETLYPVAKSRNVSFVAAKDLSVTVHLGATDVNVTNQGSKTVSWYPDMPLRFHVTVGSGFTGVGYTVVVNGQELAPDADGGYTLPAGSSSARVVVVAEEAAGPETDDGACPLCGKTHNGSIWDRVVGFFHGLIWFFTHLFVR